MSRELINKDAILTGHIKSDKVLVCYLIFSFEGQAAMQQIWYCYLSVLRFLQPVKCRQLPVTWGFYDPKSNGFPVTMVQLLGENSHIQNENPFSEVLE